MASDPVGTDQDVYREVERGDYEMNLLLYFVAGYWMAGLVIFTDGMLVRIRRPFRRRMLRIAFYDLIVGMLVLILKYGGRV